MDAVIYFPLCSLYKTWFISSLGNNKTKIKGLLTIVDEMNLPRFDPLAKVCGLGFSLLLVLCVCMCVIVFDFTGTYQNFSRNFLFFKSYFINLTIKYPLFCMLWPLHFLSAHSSEPELCATYPCHFVHVLSLSFLISIFFPVTVTLFF